MSNLVQCPGCGNGVSKRADRCPQCGEPIHVPMLGRPGTTQRTIGLILLAFLIAVALAIYTEFGK